MTEQRRERYNTLLILCAGFAFIGWRLHNWYLPYASGAILLAGIVSTFLLERITKAWLRVGEMIGSIMSRVILSVIFIFFLTPISVLYRALGRKNKGFGRETYFRERNHTYIAADLEKIF